LAVSGPWGRCEDDETFEICDHRSWPSPAHASPSRSEMWRATQS